MVLEEGLLGVCRDCRLASLACTGQSLTNIDHLASRCSWTEQDTALSFLVESGGEWRLTVGVYALIVAALQIDLVFDERQILFNMISISPGVF